MAITSSSNQVKFNYGPLASLPLGTGHEYDLNFLAKNATLSTNRDFGYIYFGDTLSATKYLKYLDVASDYYQGATPDQNDIIVNLSYNGGSPIVGTGKRFVPTSVVNPSSGTYTPADTDIMSALAVTNYVANYSSGHDIYHTGAATSGTGWTISSDGSSFVWKATKVHSTSTSDDLGFMLPIATAITKSGTPAAYSATTIPTTAAVGNFVEEYVAGLAGGMRYCGAVSSTTLPTSDYQPYKPGDTFKASAAFTIGSGSGAISVEVGDLVVLNSSFVAPASGTGTLTTSNCDVFEGNVTGAVTAASTLTNNALVVGDGGARGVKTLATSSTNGRILQVVSGSPAWADYYYEKITNGTSGDDSFTVTPYTNGTAGTATTITIDDVSKAKSVKHTSDTSTNGDIPLLLAGATSPTNNKYYAVKYSGVKYNPYTLTISGAKEMTLTQNNVSVNVYEGLIWHTLTTS